MTSKLLSQFASRGILIGLSTRDLRPDGDIVVAWIVVLAERTPLDKDFLFRIPYQDVDAAMYLMCVVNMLPRILAYHFVIFIYNVHVFRQDHSNLRLYYYKANV